MYIIHLQWLKVNEHFGMFVFLSIFAVSFHVSAFNLLDWKYVKFHAKRIHELATDGWLLR